MKYAKNINGTWRVISLPVPNNTLMVSGGIKFNPKPEDLFEDGYVEFDDTIPSGYATNGYELQNGKLKYVLVEIPISNVPEGWVYPERKIRLTIPKNLCKRNGDYAGFITDIYVENTPIVRTATHLTVYFEEVNTGDGFSLANGTVTHADPRLVVECSGTFEVINNVIVSENV